MIMNSYEEFPIFESVHQPFEECIPYGFMDDKDLIDNLFEGMGYISTVRNVSSSKDLWDCQDDPQLKAILGLFCVFICMESRSAIVKYPVGRGKFTSHDLSTIGGLASTLVCFPHVDGDNITVHLSSMYDKQHSTIIDVLLENFDSYGHDYIYGAI